jgi:hypothetical protein
MAEKNHESSRSSVVESWALCEDVVVIANSLVNFSSTSGPWSQLFPVFDAFSSTKSEDALWQGL